MTIEITQEHILITWISQNVLNKHHKHRAQTYLTAFWNVLHKKITRKLNENLDWNEIFTNEYLLKELHQKYISKYYNLILQLNIIRINLYL